MAQVIGIVGPSGFGKTRSIKTMNPKDTFIINCDKKPLSFPGHEAYSLENKNYYETSDTRQIETLINKIANNQLQIKNIIIDTVNFIMNDKEMSDEFAARSKGGEALKKWSELASEIYNMNNTIRCLKRQDLLVFEMFHEGMRTLNLPDGTVNDTRCILTNGRKLEKIVLEAGMTVVLFCQIRREEGKNIYGFETQANYSTAKSPEDCFSNFTIPNDLKMVETAVRKFYKLPVVNEVEKEPTVTPSNKKQIQEI
jgi:AAA domain